MTQPAKPFSLTKLLNRFSSTVVRAGVEPTSGDETKRSDSDTAGSDLAASTVEPTSGIEPQAPKVSVSKEQKVAVMRGADVSVTAVSRAMSLPRDTVRAIEAKPVNRELIQATRATIQRTTLRGLRRHTQAAYQWLGETIENRDANNLRKVTGALLSMEKIASSASGEARRVEQTINQTVDGQLDVTVEAKALLAALLDVKGDK